MYLHGFFGEEPVVRAFCKRKLVVNKGGMGRNTAFMDRTAHERGLSARVTVLTELLRALKPTTFLLADYPC